MLFQVTLLKLLQITLQLDRNVGFEVISDPEGLGNHTLDKYDSEFDLVGSSLHLLEIMAAERHVTFPDFLLGGRGGGELLFALGVGVGPELHCVDLIFWVEILDGFGDVEIVFAGTFSEGRGLESVSLELNVDVQRKVSELLTTLCIGNLFVLFLNLVDLVF